MPYAAKLCCHLCKRLFDTTLRVSTDVADVTIICSEFNEKNSDAAVLQRRGKKRPFYWQTHLSNDFFRSVEHMPRFCQWNFSRFHV